MRKAEEHILSAADVIGDVYDESLQGKAQEDHGQRNSAISLFPGGPAEPQAHSSEGDHELARITAASGETEIEPRERSTSRRNKKKPIFDAGEYLEYVAAHTSPETEAPRVTIEEPDAIPVDLDVNLQTGRPPSLCPGPSFVPKEAN